MLQRGALTDDTGLRRQLPRPMLTNGELSAANFSQISAFSKKKKKKSLNDSSKKSVNVVFAAA